MLVASKIIFPVPPPSYDFSLPNLFRLPRKLDKINQFDEADYPTREAFLSDSIPCLHVQSEHSKVWLIYSHGNACDIGHMRQHCKSYSKHWKVNVIAYEYKGYGVARGNPNPKNVKNDITIVFQFLTTILNVPPKNIILFGRSIGTGPSCYLARKIDQLAPNSLGCLILQSPYTTIRSVATAYVGGIGVAVPKCFDNIKNITHVTSPTVFIHGEKDQIIPFDMSNQLFAASPTDFKIFVKCPNADHNSWNHKQDVIRPVRDFLEKFYEPVFDCKPVGISSPTFSWFFQKPKDRPLSKHNEGVDEDQSPRFDNLM